MTKKSFKDVLFARLEREKMTMKDLERLSKVPYDRIYNLKKRPASSTSVDTAIQIANGFGQTLDEFMAEVVSLDREREILRLATQLTAEDFHEMVGFGKGLLSERERSQPQSGEDGQ